MAHTQVLLLQPIDGLGGEGEQVKVRAGYARNFLLPRKLATPINRGNRRQVEVLKQRRIEREQKELGSAKEIEGRLATLRLAFPVKTGEGGRVFGSVTATDLHDKLVAEGITLDKKRIHLAQPVKALGKHTVQIRLHPEVKYELEFEVVSENPIEPVAEEAPARGEDRGRPERAVRAPRRAEAEVVAPAAAPAPAAAVPEDKPVRTEKRSDRRPARS